MGGHSAVTRCQLWIGVAAAVAVTCPCNPIIAVARGADVRAHMSVTATVTERVSFHVVHQALELVVTQHDVERGYVRVSGGSTFEVGTRGNAVLDFRPRGTLVESFRVSANSLQAEFGREGTALVQRISGSRRMQIDYVFVLGSGASPGRYPWPVSLTVYPL